MKNTKSVFRVIFLAILFVWFVQLAKAQDESSKRVRPAQITFITPIGTNGAASSEIINNFSLNLLVGVSGGVHGFELGGLINQVRGDVRGVQVGGLGNFAGGNLKGVQFGGLYNVVHGEASGTQISALGNYTRGHVKGLSFGGLYNITRDYASGAQFSGLVNLTEGPLKGAQFSGLTNINTAETHGHQYSGLFNYSKESLYGAQVAGLMNQSSYEMRGLQAAGLMNLQKGSSNGLQIAGLMNITTKDIKGSQIAGLVNIARNVNGFQLSLINIADTVEKGVPLGLFSIVKDGYRTFEVEANETFYMNLTYKMGIKRLYTIYTVGFRPVGDKNIWSPGIGLGTYRDLSSRVGLSIEGIASQVNEDEWWTEETNILNRIRINASYNATSRLSVYGGLSLNVHISKVKDDEGKLVGSAIDPAVTFYEEVHNQTLVTIYPGINFGLRF
jgi:hypothetical protein